MDKQLYLLGIITRVIALSCFCVLSLGFEQTKITNINSYAQFGIICLMGSMMLLPFILLLYKKQLKLAKLNLYPIRAITSIIAMVSWIEAIKYFGANQTVLISYLAPIMTIIVAYIINKEKPNLKSLIGSIFCYLTIFFILKVDLNFQSYGCLMAILAAFSLAIYEVICQRQTSTEHFLVQVFYTFLFAALFLLIFIVPVIFKLSADELFSLLILSILRTVTIILIFVSLKLTSINRLAPVSYLKFPLLALWGYILNNKIPQKTHLLGAILLIIVNIVISKLMNKNQKT